MEGRNDKDRYRINKIKEDNRDGRKTYKTDTTGD